MNNRIKTVAVYLGSSQGRTPDYAQMVRELGSALAGRGRKVVYGGADVGLMKVLADAVTDAGGYLIGVFPNGFGGKREVQAQNVEILRKGMSETILVKDFAERKQRMEALSDCGLVLPGGFGSMDELFCYAVGNEIALHDKIVYVLNYKGFYEGLKAQVRTMVEEGFLPKDCGSVVFVDTPAEFLDIIG